MHFPQYFSWWRRSARPAASGFRTRQLPLLQALTLLFVLCGCAGVVSQSSNSSITFSISGSITPSSVGNGTTITLSGPISASTTCDSSGNYSFSGLVKGTYAVTPSRSGYSFDPSVQSVVLDDINATGINFAASQQPAYSVSLSWHASSSVVAGYDIYRSTTNGGPYQRINSALITSLSYTDSSVQGATTYFYVCTAVDSSGVESEYSNQATAAVP